MIKVAHYYYWQSWAIYFCPSYVASIINGPSQDMKKEIPYRCVGKYNEGDEIRWTVGSSDQLDLG